MIELTPVAAEKLTAIRASDPSHGVLRLYVAGRAGCSGYRYGLAFDTEAQEQDTVVERLGIPVVIDPTTLELARGSTIDFITNENGEGFVVNTPDTGGGCGGGCACGK